MLCDAVFSAKTHIICTAGFRSDPASSLHSLFISLRPTVAFTDAFGFCGRSLKRSSFCRCKVWADKKHFALYLQFWLWQQKNLVDSALILMSQLIKGSFGAGGGQKTRHYQCIFPQKLQMISQRSLISWRRIQSLGALALLLFFFTLFRLYFLWIG